MKKKRVPVFLICYLLFLAAGIAFWLAVIHYVNRCLIRYEAAQPERFIEEAVERLQAEGVNSLFSEKIQSGRFESKETVADYYDRWMKEKTIVWQRDKASYNTKAPAYRIYADEELLGRVVLRETSSEPLMSILSISEWEIGEVELAAVAREESVTVTVPENFGVFVNGVQLGENDMPGEAFVPKLFEYAKEYVAVPKIVEYRVELLLEKPTVEITDGEGRPVAFEESCEGTHTRISAESFPVSEMDPQLAERVLANAERYTNFFTIDLPGSDVSTAPIADLFPKDSYYLTLAEKYRREDMWMMHMHLPPVFENEKVFNYVRYSDELFSCEIYFDKLMTLPSTNQTVKQTTHDCVFYGLLNGEWKILDIQPLLD